MNRFREKMARFMQGRYGVDEFGRFLLALILVLMVLSFLLRSRILDTLVGAGLIYSYFRMLSRNYAARYAENQKFLSLKGRLLSGRGRGFAGAETDRSRRIFRCPTCGQKVRVPRGKGRISIHCPKCNHDFIRRS